MSGFPENDVVKALKPLVQTAVARAKRDGSVSYYESANDAKKFAHFKSQPVPADFEVMVQAGAVPEGARFAEMHLPPDDVNAVAQLLLPLADRIVCTAAHLSAPRVAYVEVVDGNLRLGVAGGV